ncbi:MAG: FxsA family protein [Thioploca sp.]|nr:FxsA family protein [Thioploca sp.]
MNLSQQLFWLFLIIPLIEIYLFIMVVNLIGILSTLFLVILSAIVGTYILRIQGVITLQTLQMTLEKRTIPTEALLESILQSLGGVLLIIPGFFTDVLGLACLIPGVRRYLFLSWYQPIQPTSSSQTKSPRQPMTIEGEYRREQDK